MAKEAAKEAAGGMSDFFQLPDMHLPDIKLQEIFGDYAKIIEQVWEKAPAMIHEYWKMAQETWQTYTENHMKRFESLPADDQRRFMNSGVDGAVVFLLLTTISRLILIRFLEPFLKVNFRAAPNKGFSLTYPQAKWIFSTTLLFAIWHANSHYLFDLGAPVDLALLLGLGTALGGMIYRQSHSGKECLAFFALPVLILLPVSITIAVMQYGPFITQNKVFPLVMAAVTAATAMFFIFEAPPTPVHKGGALHPFGQALRQEITQLVSTWRHTPTHIAESMSPKNIGKKAKRASSKAGERVSDFVHKQEDQGREALRVASPVVSSAMGSVYHFFQNIFLFILGIVYRFNKFLYYLYRLVIDGVVAGVKKIPGLGAYLEDDDAKGQHGHGHGHGGAHHGHKAGHAPEADHKAGDGQVSEDLNEPAQRRTKGRSRSGGRAKPNLSRRVSKSRSRSRGRH